MQANLRFGQVGAGKHFVSAACRLDHSHLGLIDLFDCLVALHVGAAHQRDLAVDSEGLAEEGLFLALQRHGNTAHGDVATLGKEVRHQGFPGRRHPVDLGVEALGQGFGHGNVNAFIAAVAAQRGVGLVVAGGADGEGAALKYFIQARGGGVGLGGACQGRQYTEG